MGMLSIVKTAPRALVKTCNKLIFKTKKVSPQLMVAGGAIITVGAFVWAIVNARKLDATMQEIDARVEETEAKLQEAKEQGRDEKTLKDISKEVAKAKREGIIAICKLMGIPCIMFAGGLIIIIGGHRILLRRFGELSTAFATLKQSYDRYRALNIAEHGKECDRRYMYGITGNEKVTDTIVDENGKEKTVKSEVPVVDPDKIASMYTFEFSPRTSYKCPKDPVNMISFLRAQEKYWNIWMETHGKPVTLAMILNDLAIQVDPDDPRNDYLLIAGWRPNGDGDNKIDFGVMRAINKPALDMLENCCILNFNCDGNLYHSTRYTKDGKKVC